jgi:hypothetical protein
MLPKTYGTVSFAETQENLPKLIRRVAAKALTASVSLFVP